MLPVYDVHSVQSRLQGGSQAPRAPVVRAEGADFASVLRAEVLRVTDDDEQASANAQGEERAAPTDSVHLGEVSRATEAAARRLASDLALRLSLAGVDLERDIVLMVTPGGALRVANGHPQAVEIEDALQDAQAVQCEVGLIAAGAELLRAAREHRTLVSLYELDPAAAAARRAKTRAAHSEELLHIALDANGVHNFYAPVAAMPVRPWAGRKRA